MSESSGTVNLPSSSMSKFSVRAAILVGVYSLLTSRHVRKSFTKLGKPWSRISAEATDKLPGWEERYAKTAAWSYDMEKEGEKVL